MNRYSGFSLKSKAYVKLLSLVFGMNFLFFLEQANAEGENNSPFTLNANTIGLKCSLQVDDDQGFPEPLSANEHLAKWDCGNEGTPLVQQNGGVFAEIDGELCGLVFDQSGGIPNTIRGHEHVAKFNCDGQASPIEIQDTAQNEKKVLVTVIDGRSCGLQQDSDQGTPDTLGRNESVAKFDCKNSGDALELARVEEDNDDGDDTDSDEKVTHTGIWYESAGQVVDNLRNPQYLIKLAEAAENVVLELSSDNTDPFLMVVDKANNQIITDDNSGDGTTARLELSLEKGEYYVVAGTTEKGESGNFELTSSGAVVDGLHVWKRTVPSKGFESEYYKKIDPNNEKDTFEKWRQVNGFNNPDAQEIEARYFNAGDIYLGREIRCIENGEKIACSSTNYGAPGDDSNVNDVLDDTFAGNNPLASVNMEFDPNDPDNKVKYYVYSGETGERLEFLQLDNQQAKSVPGVCLNCHGGNYNEEDVSVTDSTFLFFDLETFEFGREERSESAQSESLRKLNSLVREVNLALGNDAIVDLIDGVYKNNVDTPGQLYDKNYVPPAWKDNDNDEQYNYVIKPHCRGCHVALALQDNDIYNFEDDGAIDQELFEPFICQNVSAVTGETLPVMPHAEASDTHFWEDLSAIRLAVSNPDKCRKTRFGVVN